MSERKWIYHRPKFDCDQHHPEVYVYAPWEGHRRFAYDYVSCIQPSAIVELGSHYGGSAFSFLQAVKDRALDTHFYAVDTWKGDDFTRCDYDEDIFSHYCFVNDTFFSEQNSYMLRMTFDEACSHFSEGSIDLLHIDGSHNYNDVRHDYLTWKDKMSPNGVIFFHDIGEDLVFGEVMGSHVFWEEIKASGQLTLEVPFSNGLGILFQSEELYTYIRDTVDFNIYQQYYNLRGEEHKDALRTSLFQIRDLKHHRDDLVNQMTMINNHLHQYAQEASVMKDYISQLEACRDTITEQNKELQKHITKYEADVPAMKDYISQLEKNISGVNDLAAGKECYIQELLAQQESLVTRLQMLESQNIQIADEKKVLEQKYVQLLQAINRILPIKLWLRKLGIDTM